MSQFLAPYFDSIPLGYSILQVQNQIAGYLTSNGWQVIAQVDSSYTDFIPPSSESIGTTKFREVVRVYYTNTTITIGSYQACIADAYPQSIRVTAKTAGVVAAAITIDGATVTGAIGSAGSTANDNLRELFYALKASGNATIMGWDYWYNGTDTIICTNKIITAPKTCSGNANVNYYALSEPVLSGARSGYANLDATYGYPVTMDLTNGFIIYVQVNKRSFCIGTKCLSGKYGPIFASYQDHAAAMAAVPPVGFCTPVELVIGDLGNTGAPTASCRVTHWWSIPSAYTNHAIPNSETTQLFATGETPTEFHPWTGCGAPGVFTDAPMQYNYYTGVTHVCSMGAPIIFSKLGLATSASPLDGLFKVTPLASGLQLANLSGGYQGSALSYRFLGAIILDDIFKWTGTEPDEACTMANPPILAGQNGVGITLQQDLDATSTYSSILLSTTSGLAPTGELVIGLEEFAYMGTSGGNTITGVSRAQNGTTMARHFINEQAKQVTWFLKLNNGALMAGSSRPV